MYRFLGCGERYSFIKVVEVKVRDELVGGYYGCVIILFLRRGLGRICGGGRCGVGIWNCSKKFGILVLFIGIGCKSYFVDRWIF